MRITTIVLALGVIAGSSWLYATVNEGASTSLKVGDPAPDFTLPDQHNKPIHLADLLQKQKEAVVLAWFVKANTSG